MQIRATLEYTRGAQIGVGLGANSKVYEIDEPQLGGKLVAKEIDKSELKSSAYFDEAKALYASTHANIVPIQYACSTSTTVCLVMPFYQNGCISHTIAVSPMRQTEAIRITSAVLAALGHIHSKGYVHLDVKPSNVLLSDSGVPLLSDFGHCRPTSALGTAQNPGVHWRGHAPEILTHDRTTVHTDIYQTGLLLYRLLNGDPVWNAQWPSPHDWPAVRNGVLKGKLPDRKLFLPHVLPRLRTLVRTALQVSPARRFNTASDFRRSLGRVAVGRDWATTCSPGGATTWSLSRENQPDLVVTKARTPDAKWAVDVTTVQGSEKPRAKSPRLFRRSSLSDAEATAHLNVVFRAL